MKRDLLIDALNSALKDHFDYVALDKTIKIADSLLDDGWTLPTRCKNCLYAERIGGKIECMHDHGPVELRDENDFCSYGEPA